MSPNKPNTEPTVRDQLKKFILKGALGFQTVLVHALGTRLGIFDYLYEKGKTLSASGEVDSITFTLDELAQKLQLDHRHLDAWLHMALICGIFEIDESCDRCLKTAPHVYEILVNQESMFYMGGTLNSFYIGLKFQERMEESFKTGELMPFIEGLYELPEENRLAQSGTASLAPQIESLFSKHFKDHKRVLRKGGLLLEAGCGYGYNLEFWARKYKKAEIVGIDIDPLGIAYTKELIAKNNWNDKVEVLHIPIDEYAASNKNKFDVAMLNQVLHEMDPDENYRRGVFEDLYAMLKEGGLLIVVEHMIPSLFTPTDRFMVFEVWHKYFEVGLKSKFYDEKEFQEFIATTPFKKAEFIRERWDSFWALKK